MKDLACRSLNRHLKVAYTHLTAFLFPIAEDTLSRISVGICCGRVKSFDSKFLSKSSQAVVQIWLRGGRVKQGQALNLSMRQ